MIDPSLRRFRLFNAHLDEHLSENDVKSRFRFARDCINYLADLFSDDFNSEKHRFPVCSSKSMDAYHSTKKVRGEFPEISMGKWYSLFSSAEDDNHCSLGIFQ